MRIELTRGQFTIIDDEDWDLVKGYRWTANRSRGGFYAMARYMVDGVQHHVLMHRLILGVTDSKVLVDHADNNSLNNCRQNLRTCTHAENMRNSRVRSHSKSGIKNVSHTKINGVMRWLVTIRLDGKRHRKAFWSADDANAYAVGMRQKLHGAFAAPLGATISERKA